MSFYINNNNPVRPGPITNNPLNGLCDKVLIEVNRVFDACFVNETLTGVALTVTDYNPADPTLPLTYIGTETDLTTGPTLTDVTITRLENAPTFATVTGTVTFPLIVTYKDAAGIMGTATSTYTTNFSTVLCVPEPALNPVDITVSGVVTSTIGTYTTTDTFTVTLCMQLLIKVVSMVDLLVPSYGYPCIPECQTMPTVCPGAGEINLYPTAGIANTPTMR